MWQEIKKKKKKPHIGMFAGETKILIRISIGPGRHPNTKDEISSHVNCGHGLRRTSGQDCILATMKHESGLQVMNFLVI